MTTRFVGLAVRLGRTVILATALGGVALAGASAETDAPGPWDVIGYAMADRSGPSKTWSLPEDLPYLAVPYVGDELNGAVATIRIGDEVGAALFQRPFFASRDVGCALALGSDGRPDLRWLGATARFEPGGAGMPPNALAAPDPNSGGYASFILFRKDLGPPPGVLLMHRRRMMGSMCLNPSHKLFYSRVFVPAAAGAARSSCFDMVGAFDVGDAIKQSFRFISSDRIVLLGPEDLSERYRAIQHRFTVTLFDGLACSGNPLSFNSAGMKPITIKLDNFGFRDKTRSVRIVYQSGPLTAYLKRAETPPRIAAQPEPSSQPEARPAVKQTPEPAPVAQVTEAPMALEPATAPELEPELEPAPPVAPDPEVAAAALEPEPAQPEPALAEAPEPAEPEPALAEAPEPAEPEPALAEAPEPTPSPRAIQQAMPKLEPVLLPETRVSLALASQTFQYPIHDIYRLNYCLNWSKECGEPAARAWCKSQGFSRASGFKIDENIGSLFPTIVLGESRVCAQFVCDGFQEITCAN